MSGRVDLGPIALHTRLDGPEGAPWLVLSNSLGADLSMWDGEVAAFSDRYRILRYDTRGHGGSDVPPGPYSLDDLVGDAAALLDHFGIERCTFMGLSMGGMTGLGLALQHPQRLGALVCADARADAPPFFRDMWDARIAKVEAGGLAAIADGTVESWISEAHRTRDPAIGERIRAMVTSHRPEGYIACCRALKDLDYLRRLPELTVPTLYVGGELDKGAPVAVMAEMAAATPEARHEVVPGAAHLANLDQPEAFRAAVAGVLAREAA